MTTQTSSHRASTMNRINRYLLNFGWDLLDHEQVDSRPLSNGARRLTLGVDAADRKVILEAHEQPTLYEPQLHAPQAGQGALVAGVFGDRWLLCGRLGNGERGAQVLEMDESALGCDYVQRALMGCIGMEAVYGGTALGNFSQLCRKVAATQQVDVALNEAWRGLLGAPDDLLVDLILETVKDKLPNGALSAERCQAFLRERSRERPTSSLSVRRLVPGEGSGGASTISKPTGVNTSPQVDARPTSTPTPKQSRRGVSRIPPLFPGPPASNTQGPYRYELLGRVRFADSKREVLIEALKALIARDSTFAKRFQEASMGRIRALIARSKEPLYPGRPDLMAKNSRRLAPGWWIGVNISGREILKHLQTACDVAGLEFGRDLVVDL